MELMHPLLENTIAKGKFVNKDQQIIEINSGTPREQCEFLQQIILENNFKKSIEIGFAYGISTLAITEAVVKNGGSHTVIDKFEIDGWSGNGLDLIAQAGLKEKLEFREEWCYEALPELLKEKRTFDFAYIDSTKQFDWIMMNFFFLDRLLDKNGVIVFDDADFPGIRKVLRLVCQFPSYEVEAQFPLNIKPSMNRRIFSSIKIIPGFSKLLKQEVVSSDYKRGLNARCVAVRKKGDDNRPWDWHEDF
jgi:predicted O-methyltransferase YrrM